MDPDQAVLGRSLRLADGDVVFHQGDFVEITGPSNFIQAMEVMIETPFGSDLFNVNYGFDLIGILQVPQTPHMTKELIRLNLVKSLSRDTRVREIRDVIFDDDPAFFEIAARQSPEEALSMSEAARAARKSARRWQAVVVLTTVRAQDVALKLEGTT